MTGTSYDRNLSPVILSPVIPVPASIDQYVDYLPAMLEKKFIRVGHKGFGRGIGCAYNQARMSNDYTKTIPYKEDAINSDERIEFEGKSINLISHDGLHLTRAGAKRYAELSDFSSLFN